VDANPPCTCSYCEVNYVCPNCLKLREQDGTCRRPEEEKARREQKWKRDMQMLEGILETKLANEVAEFAGQFFDSVDPSGVVVQEVEDIDHRLPSPVPSHIDMQSALSGARELPEPPVTGRG
jgi:hypothetical protein